MIPIISGVRIDMMASSSDRLLISVSVFVYRHIKSCRGGDVMLLLVEFIPVPRLGAVLMHAPGLGGGGSGLAVFTSLPLLIVHLAPSCFLFDSSLFSFSSLLSSWSSFLSIYVMSFCDIQCIRWFPALSMVSVRYSGPLWDVA